MLATVLIALAASAAPLAAQDTAVRADSAPPPPLPPPPAPAAPTPEQARYLEGLRTVARGVAQLKDGVNRVARTQQAHDTVRQRQAGRRLGGLCTTARSFISSGRPRMQPSAYSDSVRIMARVLVVRIDSLLKSLPTCETTAGKTPAPVAADLLNRLRAYELALANFRAGIGLRPRTDTVLTPSRQ